MYKLVGGGTPVLAELSSTQQTRYTFHFRRCPNMYKRPMSSFSSRARMQRARSQTLVANNLQSFSLSRVSSPSSSYIHFEDFGSMLCCQEVGRVRSENFHCQKLLVNYRPHETEFANYSTVLIRRVLYTGTSSGWLIH